MFGFRYSSLFKSRWMALLWAILICLSAVRFVGTDTSGANADDANADVATGSAGHPIGAADTAAP